MKNKTVELDTPIVRGDTKIEKITLRKPSAGELRGTSLASLLQMDVDALQKVLPRISEPTLTTHEIAAMDPADLVQLAGEFASFLAPKALQASMGYPEA